MPTSPESAATAPSATTREIEEVFGDGRPQSERTAPAPTLLAEWRRFGAFLKRPSLSVGQQDGSPLLVLARIYVLDAAVMFVLIGAASLAIAMGIIIPATALAGIEFTLPIVLGVIVAAPVLEEIVFRGWLSGKPGPILALVSLGLGAGGFAFAHMSSPALGIGLAVAGIVGAVLALLLLRKSGAMPWFDRLFPVFFWGSTLAFALVHLANFDARDDWGSLAILLPLVLPQFALGMMLGYVRVRFALWAAILLHAAHNATALSIAALAT